MIRRVEAMRNGLGLLLGLAGIASANVPGGESTESDVMLADNGTTATMDNGIVALHVIYFPCISGPSEPRNSMRHFPHRWLLACLPLLALGACGQDGSTLPASPEAGGSPSRVLVQESRDGTTKLRGTWSYQYTGSILSRIENHDPKGKLTDYSLITSDTLGRLITNAHYDTLGHVTYVDRYTYGNDEKPLIDQSYWSLTSTAPYRTMEYMYDALGRRTSMRMIESGAVTDSAAFYYTGMRRDSTTGFKKGTRVRHSRYDHSIPGRVTIYQSDSSGTATAQCILIYESKAATQDYQLFGIW